MVIVDIDVEMAAASEAKASDSAEDNIKTRFPRVFYDYHTGLLLGDPVVNQRGVSVERARTKDKNHQYPNRALKSLIDAEVDFIYAHPEYTNLDGLSWNLSTDQGLPDQFYCPITRDIMMEPVVSPDGYTFDREAIESWIKSENETCPVSRMPLKQNQLRPNLAIHECIQTEVSKPYEEAHPDVKRWRDSKLATSLAETTVASPPTRTGPPTVSTQPFTVSTQRPSMPRQPPTRLVQPCRMELHATTVTQTRNELTRVRAGKNDRIITMSVFLVGFLILIFMNAMQ